MSEFLYLATPYTKYPYGHEAAFLMACRQAALLLRNGVKVYSPIAHMHSVAIHGGMDISYATPWMEIDLPFMEAAKGIIVCRMTGWDVSHGVTCERQVFEAAGKPVIWMDPGVILLSRKTPPFRAGI
jgi:nucleoside 2-deoxyribosyltransferase